MRLLLVGQAGAGKDTVADYLAAKYGFTRYAFADKLKQIARELFPAAFTGGKPRSLLQNIGTYMRQEDPDVWVNYLLQRITAEDPMRAVITDCRYRNELTICRSRGFIPVLISCPEDVRRERLEARGDSSLTAEQASHPSENDVFAFLEHNPPEHVLDNSGSLENLHRQIDELMTELHVPDIPSEWKDDARPSWEETFMSIARIVAQRSTCLRRKVGAVLVKSNRIIATGYNGAPKGLAHCAQTGGCLRNQLGVESGQRHELCRAVHAEENCIIQAATFGVSTDGAVLYSTHFPCSLCTRTLINAGIRKIYYKDGYPDELAMRLLNETNITVRRWTG